MGFLEIVLTILAAIIIGVIFYYVFKLTGPWGSLWSFLLILILAGVAAEAWISPVGPVVWNVAWVPTLLVIITFALLLAAATPPRDRTTTTSAGPNPSKEESAAIAIGAFFWIFLLVLLAFTLWGMFY
ncbi:MAG: hypothetical protein ACOC2M_04960 [bacterium]